jgi:hypothetical protein
MPTKASSQDIASSINSSNCPPNNLQEVLGSSTIHKLNQKLFKCERNILKVCTALLEMDRKVNAVLKSCRRQAPPVYRRTSTASMNSGKQVIRDGIHNINTTESFTLLASSFDDKSSLEILLSTTTSFTLSAAATSFTLAATANSHNEDPSELETKQLKRMWEQIDSHKGDRGCGVSRPQSPTLFRHRRIKRRDETQYILPDDDVAYSSRAVTYLSEIGVARRGSLINEQHHNLPLARRRMLCQQC